MRPVRILLIAIAAILVAGAVASAAPPIMGASEDEATPEASATPSAEPTDAPEPTEAPEPTDTEPPAPVAVEAEAETSDEDDATEDEAAGAPDFSACAGLHGLENAICRHEALLAVQPDNVGLQNALAQLEANLAKHEEQQAGDAEANTAEDGGKPSCPGKSCEAHGNAGGDASGNGA